MIKITSIIEINWIKEFLIKRNLIKQYKKSKISILAWIVWGTDLKTREPKEKWVWSFRMNKQFRAFCKLENDLLILFKIDNHQ
jgi:plasmid maintenance system killer protein